MCAGASQLKYQETREETARKTEKKYMLHDHQMHRKIFSILEKLYEDKH